jgi:hypothetical protein
VLGPLLLFNHLWVAGLCRLDSPYKYETSFLRRRTCTVSHPPHNPTLSQRHQLFNRAQSQILINYRSFSEENLRLGLYILKWDEILFASATSLSVFCGRFFLTLRNKLGLTWDSDDGFHKFYCSNIVQMGLTSAFLSVSITFIPSDGVTSKRKHSSGSQRCYFMSLLLGLHERLPSDRKALGLLPALHRHETSSLFPV